MMPRHRFPDRAVQIAARSGFITRAIFYRFVFEGESIRGAEKAWASLTKRKYFVPYPNTRIKDVLVLNRKSLPVLEATGGLFASPPYERQLRHDELVLRGVLELEKDSLLEQYNLEPELKSQSCRQFRITASEFGAQEKYADAMLNFRNPSRAQTVALELELTLKSKKEYNRIMSAYSFLSNVNLIVFVTPHASIKRSIEQAMDEVYFPKGEIPVGFASLSNWEKSAPDCPIFIGKMEYSFRSLPREIGSSRAS